jgi:RNA polymerase subunit RPABC4/transcription elongation factor Spt4
MRCLECGAEPEAELVCQRCGTLVRSTARFCRKCGSPILPRPDASGQPESISAATAPVSPAHACRKCGHLVPAGVQYCLSCGSNQESSNQEPQHSSSETVLDNVNSMTFPIPNASACSACGTEPRGSGRFCYECGRFLASEVTEVVCPKCGYNCILRYSRCQYCGYQLPQPE